MTEETQQTEEAPASAAGAVYREKVPSVEAVQFDGENGEEVVEFVGGEDYGKVSGKNVELSLQGKDPRSAKQAVSRGQWIAKTPAGALVVLNEGEFMAKYETKEGEPVEPLEPEPEKEPEEEPVYQPGFAPPAEEAQPAQAQGESQG